MNPEQQTVTLAVTMGDPRGVGPEIIAKALGQGPPCAHARALIVGALPVLRAGAEAADVPLELSSVDEADGTAVIDLDNFPPSRLEPREPCAESGRAGLDYIERAVRLVESGRADALVTCPINKEAIGAAGSPYPGHTEMLADMTDGGPPVMLMIGSGLRVALATTHVALREVPERISVHRLTQTAAVLHRDLGRLFGLDSPRVAVAGLNPHCSDGGRFGDEEDRIIRPAVEKARAGGINVSGPLPPDTVFARAAAGDYDAVIALYHDQGLIPVKFRGVHEAVNVTLGLPIIRTSVGHGTAFDIAGAGRADETSLVKALRLACEIVRTVGTPGR